jgi:hypothetical protein
MAPIETVVDRYLATWNETQTARRRDLIAQLFTENAVYTDPLASVTGYDGLDALITAVQGQFAGLQLRRGGGVDAHHDQARFSWHLVSSPSEEPVAIGFDVIVLEDGHISQVYGFLDKVPAGLLAA